MSRWAPFGLIVGRSWRADETLKRHGQPSQHHTGMRNELNFRGENPVRIRSCKYLNNIVEQDHRRKFRVSAMLGLKTFENARIVLAGIELIQKLKNGQYGVPRKFGMCSLDIWRSVLAA